MYRILMPTGDYLEGEIQFTFELNNQVFSNANAEVLPGSFAVGITVPLSEGADGNKILLGNPHLVNNARNWQTFEGVWVECYGAKMFYGTLTITACDDLEAKVNIVANPLAALKSTPLNKLNLGGDHTFADAAAVFAHAKLTALDPLDYDYVFFPVFNPDFIAHPDYSQPKSYYQNYYVPFTGDFDADHEYPAIMPFARLEYVLEQIFAAQEFTFVNRWLLGDELRGLCLYNNRSLWTDEGIELIINLQNHVSDTQATAFLRKIMSGFNLGLFTNIFSRTIALVPLNSLVNRPPRHDWTRYVRSKLSLEGNQAQADYLCWKEDDGDGAFAWYAKQTKPDPADVLGTITTPDLLTVPDGIYYVEDQHAYFSVGARIKHLYTTLGCAPVEEGKKKFEAEATALWDAHLQWETYPGSAPDDVGMRKLPHIRMLGTVSYEIPGTPDPEQISTENTIPDRITFYRGMQDVYDDTDQYPLASGLPWDANGNLIGLYSLRWDGQYGMYESWWQAWHEMLSQGKHVTLQLSLPVSLLVAFSFEDKIRILNMDYFVKKLKVGKPLGRGRVLVEASMVSTI